MTGHGTGGHGRDGGHEVDAVHETVGAYALGILDDAEASAFELHLAQCEFCAGQLDELSGMEPMLAALADLPPQPAPEFGEQFAAAPGPRVLDKAVNEVVRRRAHRRRRGFYLLAAAAALVITAPLAVLALTAEDGAAKPESSASTPAADAFLRDMDDKVHATDKGTDVTATVGMEEKGWGTHTVLELKNVKGPLKCSLIAVGKDGEEQTVSSWSVPKWGYGIEDSPNKWAREPLYVHGGSALDREDIDRFEVRTFDGRRLVEVDA
ncbi:zf-HC2 domain-containing protein [Streptomyces triticagri]|uniref:Zf-HC2 domain-containing protein n=1 Tax=Streptomyces triticagri TaxID=2293568 RepID=A0A372M891_9ACTN|nr:zf-HC2 domain-containing protein [Streptomyces triticagri]RFU87158.1 zf-HC2 domain-containing protein [Streptomyces triticagri]